MSARLTPAGPSAPAAASGAPPALRLQGVGKAYRMYATPRQRLAALVLGGRRHRSQWVLRDVTFALRRGQCMGVVGDNGAGKSSLLKLVAGTLQPSTGTVQRSGRVTAILELGSGFHPEFTGRENLFFGGQLIGLDEAEVARLAPGIIDFSELGEAIDRPVKSYSSGMVVRLAFALVTALQPEVLIIDEALAVGDQHFQKKCIERIQSFREAGCAILFCSHSMYHIRHLCDVAMWLDKGQVMAFGETEGVVSAYEAHSRAQDAATQALPAGTAGAAAPMAPVTAAVAPVAGAEIVSFEVASLSNDPVPLLLSPDLVVTMTARVPGDEVPNFSLMLEQLKGTGITVVGTHTDGVRPVRQADGLWRIRLTFPALPLNSGEYVLSPYLFDSSGLVVYEERLGYFPFRVEYPNIWPGLVRLPHHWDAGD